MRTNKMIYWNWHLPAMILFILLTSVIPASAQHDPSDLLRSKNWDIIGSLEFRLEKNNDIFPIFSSQLKKNDNKEFELTGYLIPIREGLLHSRFLLSTLPVNQCFYCGKNGIPAMILVEMTAGIAFTYRPVRIQGKLKLKNVNLRDYPPIILRNAVRLK
jgi:hypothetical protein